MEHKLVIVTGANGTLGRAYADHFDGQPDVRCVAFTRTAQNAIGPNQVIADLLDAETVAAGIDSISLEDISYITLIHPVGKFIFEPDGRPKEDEDGDGINDEVYVSNMKTFENITRPLLERIKKSGRAIPITLCAFGSLSDPYDIKYWRSYSRAKMQLRKYMRELAKRSDGSVHSIFFEVSTVDTEKERGLRPYADDRYWLSTQELVERSLPYIEKNDMWNEIQIYKPMPDFKTDYYSDLDAVREKWSREMGKELY